MYAKAVRDHFNMMDSTALSVRTGETIIVKDTINFFLVHGFFLALSLVFRVFLVSHNLLICRV